MLNRLWFKLTIAFVLIAIVGVAVVAILANRATSISVNRFLEAENSAEFALLRDELAEYYRGLGSWAGVEPLLRQHRSGMGAGIGLVLVDEDGQTVATAGSGRGNRPRTTDQAERNQDAVLDTLKWDLDAMKLKVQCLGLDGEQRDSLLARIDELLGEVQEIHAREIISKGAEQ